MIVPLKHLVHFDVETTGLDPEQHQIIQFSAKSGDNGEELDVLVKIDKRRKVSEEALEMNSYDEARWERDAITQGPAADKIAAYLKRHAYVSKTSKNGHPFRVAMLCAHNGSRFDMPFLQNMFKQVDGFLPADYRCLDSLQLAMWTMQPMPNYKLGTLADHFGVLRDNAHDAMDDVRMLHDLVGKLYATHLVPNPFM